MIWYCFVLWDVGRDSSVGIATELRAGRSGDRMPLWARFSSHVHTDPGVPVFPGVKAGLPPIPSSAKLKERVELYLYSLSQPSWPVLGRTWPLPLLVRYLKVRECNTFWRKVQFCVTVCSEWEETNNRVEWIYFRPLYVCQYIMKRIFHVHKYLRYTNQSGLLHTKTNQTQNITLITLKWMA